MNKFFTFFISSFIFLEAINPLNATSIDSLKSIIEETKNLVKKVENLNYASKLIQSRNYKQALDFANEALVIAKEKKIYKEVVNSYLKLGEAHAYWKNDKESLKNFIKAKTYANIYNQKDLLGLIYLRLTYYFLFHEGTYNALKYNRLALDVLKAEKNVNLLSYCYSLLYYGYFRMNDINNANMYHNKLISLLDTIRGTEKYDLKYAYNCLGQSYWNNLAYDSAFKTYKLYLEISIKDKDSVNIANANNCIGSTLYSLKSYSEAISFFNRAIALNETSISDSYIELVHCYIAKNNIPFAEKYFGLAKLESNVDNGSLRKACDALIVHFKDLKDRAKSDYYEGIKNQIVDAIILASNESKQISELETIEEIEDSTLLEVNNEILQSSIQANNERDISIIIAIAFGIMFGSYYYYNKKKERQRLKAESKGLINEAFREIGF